MTSACDSPVWGRTEGRFSTFTARAGWLGTRPPLGERPVNGQTLGGGDGVGDPPGPVEGVSFPEARGPLPPLPAATTTPTTAPTTTTAVITTAVSRPRGVNAMLGAHLP